jgi:hypothetical protein
VLLWGGEECEVVREERKKRKKRKKREHTGPAETVHVRERTVSILGYRRRRGGEAGYRRKP